MGKGLDPLLQDLGGPLLRSIAVEFNLGYEELTRVDNYTGQAVPVFWLTDEKNRPVVELRWSPSISRWEVTGIVRGGIELFEKFPTFEEAVEEIVSWLSWNPIERPISHPEEGLQYGFNPYSDCSDRFDQRLHEQYKEVWDEKHAFVTAMHNDYWFGMRGDRIIMV